jgi:hypothetical protein
MGRLVISSLSRCLWKCTPNPSDWYLRLCVNLPKVFLLMGPSTMKQTPNSSPFTVLDRFSWRARSVKNSLRLRNAKGPKNTFPELVAEKRLKNSQRRVVHRSVYTSDLAIHLPDVEWSTVQRVQVTVQWVRVTWRFTFPPAALYKQTGSCEVTTTFTTIALSCCQKIWPPPKLVHCLLNRRIILL